MNALGIKELECHLNIAPQSPTTEHTVSALHRRVLVILEREIKPPMDLVLYLPMPPHRFRIYLHIHNTDDKIPRIHCHFPVQFFQGPADTPDALELRPFLPLTQPAYVLCQVIFPNSDPAFAPVFGI